MAESSTDQLVSQGDQIQENQEDATAAPTSIDTVNDEDKKGGCCKCGGACDLDDSKGISVAHVFKGVLYMANIFLSTSLIFLASKEADCLDPLDENEVDGDCENRIHGMVPSSLITNIAVISGLASAFTMPLTGAIVDFTPYRRTIGLGSAILISVIQAIQIGTTENTWFYMSILQAIAGWLTQVQVLSQYAYYPEVAREVGEVKMNSIVNTWSVTQFVTQEMFLIVIVGLGFALDLDSVQTGQLSQLIQSVVLFVTTYKSWWSTITIRPPSHNLPQGRSLWTEGFLQNWRTFLSVNKNYKKSLRWFLLAVVFSEAGATAIIPVTITFLTGELGYDGSEIGLTFVIAILFSIGGTFLGKAITNKLNPLQSWKLSNLALGLATAAGSFLLTEDAKFLGYVFGGVLGLIQGWFYPAESLFFSMILPKGQEAELTGFYIYCTQILVWFPPMVFSLLVESGTEQRFGMLSMMSFQLLGIAILSCCGPWEELLEEAHAKLDEKADTDDQ